MAEMFLYLDQIEGESLDLTHKTKIEIKNWQWTTENFVRWDVNQGGQSTRVKIDHIELNKICDKASVTLYQNCVTGKHIKNGKIICRKNDGDQKVEYLIVTLTDIMVTKVNWTGDGDSPSLNETIGLAFAEFRLDYKVQDDSGSPGGGKMFAFNVQKQHGEHS